MATGQLSGDVIQHARGLYANYDSYVSQASVNKAGLVYYCTDAEGTAYHGCIVYNGTIYGQGNGGIESITTAEQTSGILVTLTLKDGSTKTFTIPKGTSATYGVVKVANSITGDNADPSLVPSYSVVKALDTNKAPKANPNFTGTPTAPTATKGTNTTQIATTAFVQEAATQAKTDAIEAILGENVDADFDTLKEVADYIASDKTNAAKIETTLSTHSTQISTLSGDMATLKSDENVAGSVKNIVNEAIGNLRESDIITKVGSASSDTLDVTLGEVGQGGKNLDIELPGVVAAGTKGGMGSAQSPDFGDIVSIAGVVVDKYGRVTGGGQPHSLTFPSKTASTEKAGLMSATDKTALNNIATALKWIDVTA